MLGAVQTLGVRHRITMVMWQAEQAFGQSTIRCHGLDEIEDAELNMQHAGLPVHNVVCINAWKFLHQDDFILI